MERFGGQVALVTGGGSGIGRASAIRFAAEGARVAVGDINEEAGRETVELITAAGGAALFVRLDVTDSASVDAFVAATVGAWGRIDCAANIAGLPQRGGLFCSDELWNRVVAVNLSGTFFCTRAEAAVMKQQRQGVIVNCSSISGLQGSAAAPFYNAVKHGVIGFSKGVALELAAHNIRVNVLCPGFTISPMSRAHFGENVGELAATLTPLGRAAEPEEQAEAVLWLCSAQASFMTGSVMTVDGGLTAGMYLKPAAEA